MQTNGGGGPTQPVEVRLHPVGPGYRAHQPRLQERCPLVDQRPLTPIVVLRVKRFRVRLIHDGFMVD